jgi:hypothetical protein
MTPIVENVRQTYLDASFDAFSSGMTWYDHAHEIALLLDSDIVRAAGIIAALSPMNEWDNNIRQANLIYTLDGEITVVKGQPNGIGLGDNVIKAIRIYRGEHPLEVLGGPKVRSFYATIVNPNDSEVDPVIDRHAFDIAVGMRTNDEARGILSRKSVYQSFVNVYRYAAEIAGITPRQMQAITWVAWKQMHGIRA